MKKLSSLSVVLPAYNDALSLSKILPELLSLLPKLTSDFEIIIVNDGSKDNTQQVLEKFKKTEKRINTIYHNRNQGYGATLIDGFTKASKEFIFYTDSDGQYDVNELPLLVERMDDHTDIITGFKQGRSDSIDRKLIGAFYNVAVKKLLNLQVKDVDCDFRLFRASLLDGLSILVTSGGFDAGFIKALERKKARFKEVGVHHYPRQFGSSQFFTPKRVIKSLLDVGRAWYYNVSHR